MASNPTPTFDIIIGDFGRLASANYAKYLSEVEQTHLTEKTGGDFFDELRQISFNLCSQLNWYKRDAIKNLMERQGFLDRSILIGIGPESVSEEFVRRGTETVLANIGFAVERNFRRIRVYAPCNGLTDLVREIVALSVSEYASERHAAEVRSNDICYLMNSVQVEFCSVPQKVVGYVCRDERIRTILVLGTSGVNKIYQSECLGKDLSVFPLSRRDYDLIDNAIVASIGKRPDEIRSAKLALEEEIISRFEANSSDGMIVEACTDFEFGVGHNSLRIFAQQMVADAYGS